jgi:hypothetical protein
MGYKEVMVLTSEYDIAEAFLFNKCPYCKSDQKGAVVTIL